MTTGKDHNSCAGCGNETVAAEITGFPPQLHPTQSEEPRFLLAGAPLQLRVCPGCGRVEFFTGEPDKFA